MLLDTGDQRLIMREDTSGRYKETEQEIENMLHK